MEYTVDYFIKKFEAIPEDLFLTKTQGDKERIGNMPHCSAGWCKTDDGYFGAATVHTISLWGFSFSSELAALVKLFKEDEHGYAIAAINNGEDPRYQQPTPKLRILAALSDIRKLQQPEVKERTVYVTVDADVRELQQKELSVN